MVPQECHLCSKEKETERLQNYTKDLDGFSPLSVRVDNDAHIPISKWIKNYLTYMWKHKTYQEQSSKNVHSNPLVDMGMLK